MHTVNDQDLRDFVSLATRETAVTPRKTAADSSALDQLKGYAGGAWDSLSKTVGDGAGHLGPYGPNLVGGLAGAALGGGATYLSSQQHGDETSTEFQARRRRNALTGGIAGGAAGAAAPMLMGKEEEPGYAQKYLSYWNPVHNRVTGAVGGSAAGALGGAAASGTVAGVANKLLSSPNDTFLKDPLKESLGLAQSVKDQGRVEALSKLLDARTNGTGAKTYGGAKAYGEEFKNLGVSRYGRLAKILMGTAALGATAGGTMGAANAWPSN